jgi:hypothetical protein
VRPTSIAFFVLVVLVSIVTPTHAQLTSNVLKRVLQIRVGGSTGITGTAFTLDVDGREYLVTAKHMVGKLRNRGAIEISVGSDLWEPIDVAVYRCDGDVDIAIFIPPRQLTVNQPLEPIGDLSQVDDGQDMYFAGFPLGGSAWAKWAPAHGDHPLPMIKKGVYSGTFESKDRTPVILLDGFNNPGFSGAPIVYRVVGHSDWTYYVFGVVSGFIPQLGPVVRSELIKPGEDVSKVESWRLALKSRGKILRDTGQYVPLNTGIVQAYPIRYAVDLIRKHAEGPKVADDFKLSLPR